MSSLSNVSTISTIVSSLCHKAKGDQDQGRVESCVEAWNIAALKELEYYNNRLSNNQCTHTVYKVYSIPLAFISNQKV